MSFGEYKIEPSREYRGLYHLTEILTYEDGRRVRGFDGYFKSKDMAILQAKSMMGNPGDTLWDGNEVIYRT